MVILQAAAGTSEQALVGGETVCVWGAAEWGIFMATERRRGSVLQEGSGEIWIETTEDSFSSDWPLRGIPVMTPILCQGISRLWWERLYNPEQAVQPEFSSKITSLSMKLSPALQLPLPAHKDSLRLWWWSCGTHYSLWVGIWSW